MPCSQMTMLCCGGDQEDVVTQLPEPHQFEPFKERMKQMIIIGHTTPSSAKIWAKVPTAGTWALTLTAKDKHDSVYVPQSLLPKGGISKSHKYDEILTHCFEFTGLKEDTIYHYTLAAAGGVRKTKDTADQAWFRTAKANYDSLKFAAYSCHDPFSWEVGKAFMGAWPLLASMKDDLDLTLAGGDQMYVDSNGAAMTDLWTLLKNCKTQIMEKFIPDGNVDNLDEQALKNYLLQLIRQYYEIYWNVSEMAEVHGRIPAYMMWDDHEIMDGWGSLTHKERFEKLQTKDSGWEEREVTERLIELTWEATAQAYAEFQHSHNPGPAFAAGSNPRKFVWDYRFNRGDYHFFMMDMRSSHDCEAEHDRLLGPDQHQRLQKWLDRLEGAYAAFILSPVPVVHWSNIVDYSPYVISSLKDDVMDGWSHPTNHEERRKLLESLFCASEKLNIPIVIVSGDVHCASAYTLTDEENYPNAKIIQVTSSSISKKPCPSLATLAYAPTGQLVTREDDGKGKKVNTSIYQKQRFAKAGVNNFVIIEAKGSDLDITFYWPSENKEGVESAKVAID